MVDQDGDGLIKLDSSAVDEIVTALKQEYDDDLVDDAKDKISVIREKVGIYVLYDDSGETESENVFSWDILKYLGGRLNIFENRPCSFKTKAPSGFTLLELLIVLAVMGLMMGLIGFSLCSGGGGAELGAQHKVNFLALCSRPGRGPLSLVAKQD